MKQAISSGLALTCLLGMASCARTPEEPAFSEELPAALASATLSRQGVICPLESVNGVGTRRLTPLVPGSVAEFTGWSTVADAERPTPPLLHIVIRSQVVGAADQFLPAVRIRRPDIANGNPRLIAAGYSARGKLPAVPGAYNVIVWVGDDERQIECDTGVLLTVR
ncbi:hypothetical protein [Lysobacter niastensis]|uniref:Lipoprotein n=1 Tax=Lysobacter niastensis TaxID=380629 RepID=A0ABS0B6G2_9GAMM|nr:hypothetical protein [Lysobacter niastensis]MBF6023247.1 hypothetical protein [Lysobacter niastensis]